MSMGADKLQLINNELAAVLMKHGACGIAVYACDEGDGSAQVAPAIIVQAPRLDGMVDEGLAFPKANWAKVLTRLLRIADTIRRAHGPAAP